jgi:ABC-type nitrate/sulfonate/bicarbonate transport system substrate-binding protein
MDDELISRRRALQLALGGAMAGPLTTVGGPLAMAADEKFPDVGTVSVGWLRATANLSVNIIKNFAPQFGFKVNSLTFKNSVDVATGMISDQVDVGVLTPVHLVRSVDQHVDFVQIAGNSRENVGIITASKLGLKPGDWDGLKAASKKRKLKIASSRGSISEMLCVACFAQHGVDVDKDVEVLNVAGFATHPQALRSGEFDILFTTEPFSSLVVIEGVGNRFMMPTDTPAGDLNTCFVVSRNWLTKNPAKARAFVAAAIKAHQWLNADKQRPLKEALKLFPLKPDVLTMALDYNHWDPHNAMRETQALAKVAFERKFASRDVSGEIPHAMEEKFLKEFGI